MAICIGCGRNLPGLDEGDFCRMCGGASGYPSISIDDYFDYERELEPEEPEEPEDDDDGRER